MARRKNAILYVEPRMPRWWDWSVVIVTVASLFIVAIDLGVTGGTPLARALGWVDFGFCMLLLGDFGVRFARANRKWPFFKRNWIDLIASIPLTGPLRAGRLLRLVRLFRLVLLTRRLRNRLDVPLSTTALGYLGLITAVVWTVMGSAFYHFESGINSDIKGLGDALWWAMTTLSTVGYGDIYPDTTGGRAVALVTMVLGVGILGSFAAALASVFIEVRERRNKGLGRYSMKAHLLILGWNDKAKIAIEDFHFDPRYETTRVAIVADLESTPIRSSLVRFVRGAPGHRDVLERAAAQHAAAAIIFAANPDDPRSDHETTLTALALRRLNPEIQISAELVDPANREHIVAAGCQSVIDSSQVSSTLLVRSVQDPGVADVVSELLTNKYGSEIYRIAIDDSFFGRPYRDLAFEMVEQSRALIGIARGGTVLVNPEPDAPLQAGDEAFVVSRDPPA